MEKLISFTLESLLLPPGGLLLLLVAGLLLLKRRPRLARALLISGTLLFYVLATPLASSMLIKPLERYPALPANGLLAVDPPSAIVVLGGGRYADAPEYGGDTVSALTLERIRYGARLARRTGLPLLVTGGSVWNEKESEGELMRRALEIDFRWPTRWVEGKSRTTWENAQRSKPLLDAAGITKVYLVTHAWHMPRSVYAFEQAGLQVIPAPTSFNLAADVDPGAFELWPDARSLRRSYFALHEMVGMLWYRLK